MTTFCDQPALLYEQSFICPFAKTQRLDASSGKSDRYRDNVWKSSKTLESCLSVIDKSLELPLFPLLAWTRRLSDVRLIETEPNHHTPLRQHDCQACSFTTYFSIMSLISFSYFNMNAGGCDHCHSGEETRNLLTRKSMHF